MQSPANKYIAYMLLNCLQRVSAKNDKQNMKLHEVVSTFGAHTMILFKR